MSVELLRVLVAWCVVFLWLTVGGFALSQLEFEPEQLRTANFCDTKAVLLSNLSLPERLAVDQIDAVLDQHRLCKPPPCLLSVVPATATARSSYNGTIVVSDTLPTNYNWGYSGAVFFCLTTVTTIGYGNYIPITPEGRAFTMAYALFGIAFYMFANVKLSLFLEVKVFTVVKFYMPDAKHTRQRVCNFLLHFKVTVLWLCAMAGYFSAFEGNPHRASHTAVHFT